MPKRLSALLRDPEVVRLWRKLYTDSPGHTPMSQYPEARFIKSANAPHQFVADEGAEVAVAGRSNAGKSSAINVLVNRRQFARTSKTPGRTQLVNFFSLRDGHRLVDLPGYGFARVSDAMRNHWDQLLTDYFNKRQSLRGLFMIVDSRRQLQDYDRQMMAFADELPIHILLTKADKLKRGQAASALLKVRKDVGDRATVQLFSSLKREGEDEARDVLERFLRNEKSRGGLRPGQ
jgi:GTP-binding protein